MLQLNQYRNWKSELRFSNLIVVYLSFLFPTSENSLNSLHLTQSERYPVSAAVLVKVLLRYWLALINHIFIISKQI